VGALVVPETVGRRLWRGRGGGSEEVS
jgi:hypothetical protein